jgi:formamidopyrimidine-DNA glycosylase
MPEVVEIRKYADFLKSKLKNKYIEKINILQGRYKKHKPFNLYKEISKELPLKVIDIRTKGKFLYIVFEKNYYLLSTLGLSGGWVYKNNDIIKFPLEMDYIKTDIVDSYKTRSLNHLNVEFIISNDKGSIFFYDTLSFGTLKGIDSKEELNKKLSHIGPDIMDENTTFEIFYKRITNEKYLNKKIGIVLMNQKVISGIGNYLRADVLWMTKISPFRKINELSMSELKNIYKSVRLLTWADYNYKKGVKLGIIKKTDKIPKDFQRDFFIYMQNKNIYGEPVLKEPLYEGSQKRMIHWVKKRQI